MSCPRPPSHESPGDAKGGAPSQTDHDETRNARALRHSWSQLIKRIYKDESLVCPFCRGERKGIVFITKQEVVDWTFRHLRRMEQRVRGSPS